MCLQIFPFDFASYLEGTLEAQIGLFIFALGSVVVSQRSLGCGLVRPRTKLAVECICGLKVHTASFRVWRISRVQQIGKRSVGSGSIGEVVSSFVQRDGLLPCIRRS